MADSARTGLSAYTTTRLNEMAGLPLKSATYQDPAANPTQPQPQTVSGSSHWTTRRTPPNTARPTSSRTMEEPKRLSGGKRDADTAAKTDVLNVVPGSEVDPTSGAPPQKKQKITYLLPNQCMEEGHFYIVLGEDIDVSTARFKMLSLLGQGTFGKVVEAWDRKYKIHCAVKVVRNIPKYTRDAGVEIKYMEMVKQADPEDKYCFMKILRYFQNDQKHMCIVMPKYGPCLLDHISKYGPFSSRGLAEIIFQAGIALDFFHTQMHMMHTDLKPENMLLEMEGVTTDPETGATVPKSHKIRICDLGGVCDERHSKTAIVSTRHYRSPEVILGMGWMYPTDMWSMGCIIFELATGKLLYDTHENLEHLNIMEKTLGKLPADWSRLCTEEHRSMFSTSGQVRTVTDPKSLSRVARAKPIREIVKDPEMLDLILNLLNYDKTRRMTARQMATHPYVLKHYPAAAQHPQFPGKTRSGSAATSAAR